MLDIKVKSGLVAALLFHGHFFTSYTEGKLYRF